jgi:hypothetical protein
MSNSNEKSDETLIHLAHHHRNASKDDLTAGGFVVPAFPYSGTDDGGSGLTCASPAQFDAHVEQGAGTASGPGNAGSGGMAGGSGVSGGVGP